MFTFLDWYISKPEIGDGVSRVSGSFIPFPCLIGIIVKLFTVMAFIRKLTQRLRVTGFGFGY